MPKPELSDPTAIVQAYLGAMEARRLDQARALLDPGFQMIFPGTGPMTSLQQLIDWAGPRYRFVCKTCQGFDAIKAADTRAIVYCRGTLAGEWPDGTAFSGIRFIDRFELVASLITRQDVWNDIAETRVPT